jgi:hypothetical protein
MTGLLSIIRLLSKDKSLKIQELMKVENQEFSGLAISKSQNVGISLSNNLNKEKLLKLAALDRSIKVQHQIQELNWIVGQQMLVMLKQMLQFSMNLKCWNVAQIHFSYDLPCSKKN